MLVFQKSQLQDVLLVVAKKLGINGIGIELKKEYIAIAINRIKEDLFTKIEVI